MDNLTELALRAKREYQKKWRQQNKDKVRQYNHDYWLRRVQKEANNGKTDPGTDRGAGR